MRLIDLQDERYALHSWTRLRPFYCRLAPELIWHEVRTQILEELKEELQANDSRTWEYATYFTYPTDEQMESIHKGSLFFSEIREIVGFRSAEALALLSGLIRLEPEGDDRVLLEESFENLWHNFSQHGYGHGYDTADTRVELVLMLASNNTFGLVRERSWIEQMRAYFKNDKHPWSGRPLSLLYPEVLRVLGESGSVGPKEARRDNGPVFNLERDDITLQSIRKDLYWEQGRSEQFDSARAPSVFYRLPYHLTRFVGRDRVREIALQSVDHLRYDPFAKTALHFLYSLCLRTSIASSMGIGRTFGLRQAATACNDDVYAARMAVGQMIKVGLVEYDTAIPWFSESQRFRCAEAARHIIESE